MCLSNVDPPSLTAVYLLQSIRILAILVLGLAYAFVLSGGTFSGKKNLIQLTYNFEGIQGNEVRYESRGKYDRGSLDFRGEEFKLPIYRIISDFAASIGLLPLLPKEYCGRISKSDVVLDIPFNLSKQAQLNLPGTGEENCLVENVKEGAFLNTKLNRAMLEIKDVSKQTIGVLQSKQEGNLSDLDFDVVVYRRLFGLPYVLLIIYPLAFLLSFKTIEICLRAIHFIRNGNFRC